LFHNIFSRNCISQQNILVFTDQIYQIIKFETAELLLENIINAVCQFSKLFFCKIQDDFTGFKVNVFAMPAASNV